MRPIVFLGPDELRSLPDLEWVVQGILPLNSLAVLYGEPGKGKSFVALSIALSMATGQHWFGRRTKSGQVLYVAAEGLRGLRDRAAAFYRHSRTTGGSILYTDVTFDLRKPDEVLRLCQQLKAHELRPDLIVLDTLARLMVGADENSARDMGEAVEGMETLKRETGASVLAIHHAGKNGNSERGSTALRGAADVMIKCGGRNEGHVELSCEKMKDAEPFKAGSMALTKVSISPGRSSLVLADWKDEFLTRKAQAHPVWAQRAVDILRTSFHEGATATQWLSIFQAETGKHKSTFMRALGEACERNLVTRQGEGQGALYFVREKPVSGVKQVPEQSHGTGQSVSVSSPLLGDDTDTEATAPNGPWKEKRDEGQNLSSERGSADSEP